VLEGAGWLAENLWSWAKPKISRALSKRDTEPSNPLPHAEVDRIEAQIAAGTSHKVVQKGKSTP
jgi:hypothetical protein